MNSLTRLILHVINFPYDLKKVFVYVAYFSEYISKDKKVIWSTVFINHSYVCEDRSMPEQKSTTGTYFFFKAKDKIVKIDQHYQLA